MMRIATMLPKLRVAQPTIGHDQGRWHGQATTSPRCQTLVEPHPRPPQLVPARCPRPHRVRPSHGTIPWDDQAPIAHDHHE